MAINFPTSLDVFTDPTASDQLNLPSHSGQHTDLNNAVEALEAKVGINSSAVTSSHDYKIAQLEAVNIASTTIGSAVSSVTVTDAFSANFDNYLVVYKIDAGSTTTGLTFVLGVGGTMTTTGYYEGRLTVNNAGTVSGAAANNVASFDLNSVSTTGGGAGSVEIFRPYATALTGIYSIGTDMRTIGAPMRTQSGWQNSTTQFTSFQIAASSGTLTGGTINVYGYAKA